MYLTSLPDDLIRLFCGYLNHDDVFKLEQTSKRFHKVKTYVENIDIINYMNFEYYEDFFKFLKSCSSLKNLDISYGAIGDLMLGQLFIIINSLQNLKKLDISCCEFCDEKFNAFSKIIKFKSLESLVIQNNFYTEFTIFHCEWIAVILNSFSSLKYFNICDNHSGDKGIKIIIDGLKSHSSIERLDFDNINIGDEGCIYLAEMLKNQSSLKYLIISKNKITNNGCKVLAEALILHKNLKYFCIEYNPGIDKEGHKCLAQALKSHKNLEYFSVDDCENEIFKELEYRGVLLDGTV